MGDAKPSLFNGRVGVVAIGRNEGERLIRCLESLTPYGLPIVYVDSASTDGSPAAAASRGATVLDLDLTKPFTAARARNEGFARLQAIAPDMDYVQFIDGDCEVEAGWIEASIIFLDQHPDAAVVCGRRRERFPEASFYNKLCDREWNTSVGESEACGGDALMRVSAFVAVDGYDDGLIAGEEPELCSRLREKNFRIWRINEPMTIHDAAMLHFRQWWLRAVRSGFGYAQVYWTTNKARTKTIGPLYRREVIRALFWAVLLPAMLVIGALFSPYILLFLPLLYAGQIARMAIRTGGDELFSWKLAVLNMVGKFGETLGISRFIARILKGQQGGTIFYK
ncbi:glycosyltransferase [Sphingorhabdus sp. Alg231-15]|uniref:glycosyltransferase n=1 Tax=Sphingorhabdus sp. Alg231-15 TaxID=1922222 RepID=UPI000D560A15